MRPYERILLRYFGASYAVQNLPTSLCVSALWVFVRRQFGVVGTHSQMAVCDRIRGWLGSSARAEGACVLLLLHGGGLLSGAHSNECLQSLA